MKEPFKHKVMGFLDFVMNAVLLNLLFLLGCIPVVTAGVSLTSLYAGLRAMIKKEPCFYAFFRTFKSGFVRAGLAWVILLPLNALVLFNAYSIWFYQTENYLPVLIVSGLMALILLSITTMLFLFYSRFEGTLLQLLRYGGTLALSYPLRAMLIAVLTWAPVAFLVLSPMTFLALGPVWLFFYFSVVSIVAIWVMNRPFFRFAAEVLGMDITPNQSTTSEEDA